MTENKDDVLTEAEIEEIHDEACDRVPPLDDDYDTGTFDWKWKMKFAQLAAKKGYEKGNKEQAVWCECGNSPATLSFCMECLNEKDARTAKAEKERILKEVLEIKRKFKENYDFTDTSDDDYKVGMKIFRKVEKLLGD